MAKAIFAEAERAKIAERKGFLPLRNSVLKAICISFLLSFLFAIPSFSQPPDPSQIPEPQIAYALHASWDPDLTDNNPSICTTSGTVAIPWFHFYAGWKDDAPAFFSKLLA